jgi:hypothetical protein
VIDKTCPSPGALRALTGVPLGFQRLPADE